MTWLELVAQRIFKFAVFLVVIGFATIGLRAQPAVRFPQTAGGTGSGTVGTGVYPPGGAPVNSAVLPPSTGAPASALGALHLTHTETPQELLPTHPGSAVERPMDTAAYRLGLAD